MDMLLCCNTINKITVGDCPGGSQCSVCILNTWPVLASVVLPTQIM